MPAGQADRSSSAAAAMASVGTEPYQAATARPERGRQAVQPKAVRAEIARCFPERPAPARGEREMKARWRAAVPEPSARAPGGAGQCHPMALPKHWAGPAAHSAGSARPEERSGPEPDAAARSALRTEREAPLAARKARSVPARRQQAAPDGAAARVRPGWREVQPAARRVGAGRLDSPRPGAPAWRGEQPVAALAQGGHQDVPGHLEQGAPGHRAAAGGAGPAGRHRRTAPAQAGAMERRNCPATTRWRG